MEKIKIGMDFTCYLNYTPYLGVVNEAEENILLLHNADDEFQGIRKIKYTLSARAYINFKNNRYYLDKDIMWMNKEYKEFFISKYLLKKQLEKSYLEKYWFYKIIKELL